MLRTTLQNEIDGQPYSRQKFLRAKTFASKGLPLHLMIYCRGNPLWLPPLVVAPLWLPPTRKPFAVVPALLRPFTKHHPGQELSALLHKL